MPAAIDLPHDIEALRSLLIQQSSALAERNTQLQVAEATVLSQKLELEKLRLQIACLKRAKFGRSSEQLDHEIAQMQLSIEDLEASLAATPVEVRPVPKQPPDKSVRRPLPEQLPREQIVHEPPCNCPSCGGQLRPLGEDISEVLEYIPSRFKVIRHVRPKLSCASPPCQCGVEHLSRAI